MRVRASAEPASREFVARPVRRVGILPIVTLPAGAFLLGMLAGPLVSVALAPPPALPGFSCVDRRLTALEAEPAVMLDRVHFVLRVCGLPSAGFTALYVVPPVPGALVIEYAVQPTGGLTFHRAHVPALQAGSDPAVLAVWDGYFPAASVPLLLATPVVGRPRQPPAPEPSVGSPGLLPLLPYWRVTSPGGLVAPAVPGMPAA